MLVGTLDEVVLPLTDIVRAVITHEPANEALPLRQFDAASILLPEHFQRQGQAEEGTAGKRQGSTCGIEACNNTCLPSLQAARFMAADFLVRVPGVNAADFRPAPGGNASGARSRHFRICALWRRCLIL